MSIEVKNKNSVKKLQRSKLGQIREIIKADLKIALKEQEFHNLFKDQEKEERLVSRIRHEYEEANRNFTHTSKSFVERASEWLKFALLLFVLCFIIYTFVSTGKLDGTPLLGLVM